MCERPSVSVLTVLVCVFMCLSVCQCVYSACVCGGVFVSVWVRYQVTSGHCCVSVSCMKCKY